MVTNNQINNDEINLVELIRIIWDGKWKVVAAIFISVISVIIYQKSQTKYFTATTDIQSISTAETYKYTAFNSYADVFNIKKQKDGNANIIINTNNLDDQANYTNYNKIDKDSQLYSLQTFKLPKEQLLDLYIDILNEKSLFEEGIRKYNLVDVNEYNDEEKYNEAVIKLAASIKIFSKTIPEEVQLKQGVEVYYNNIRFKYHDKKKWNAVLKYVDEKANILVKTNLNKSYKKLLTAEKQNVKFELEDLSKKINNFLLDYDRQSQNRIYYLEEQSAIAKQLGIAKNTIEVQTLGNQKTLLSTVNLEESPFYLRGYEAINKEIELIRSRVDKKAFIPELDSTLIKKRMLEQDVTLDRAELLFQSTPLGDENNFYAAKINVLATKFSYKNDITIQIVAMLFGLIIGCMYVIILKAFQTQEISRKK